MDLDIYKKCGPAGTGELNLNDHTVNTIWFLELLKTLKSTHKGRCFTTLEIGSGAGGVLSHYKNVFANMTAFACDVYTPALLTGKREHKDLLFFAADGCHLSLKEECFDVAIIHDVLEHVEAPNELLQEAYRALRPGGSLHLFVPCEGQRGTIHAVFRTNIKKKHGHIQNFKVKEIFDMLVNAGFSIKTQTYSFHIIGQIADLIPYLIDRNHTSIISRIAETVTGLLARAAFVESRLLKNYPGLCLEIVAIK